MRIFCNHRENKFLIPILRLMGEAANMKTPGRNVPGAIYYNRFIA
jgi:hypothetical protein